MAAGALSLESVRESLVRQEDTIVFSLIERAQHPLNSPAYDATPGLDGSLVEVLVKETEVLHAKLGRYKYEEENAFFPDDMPQPLITYNNHPQVLHPAAAKININNTIWKIYFDKLLPLITANGDDGNVVSTCSCDLSCLQALSKRIHYGKFVAEVKYQDAPQDYEPAIRAQDRDALMRLLTFEKVEEMVKKRVANKAKVFGQEIISDSTEGTGKQKIDPSVASLIYEEWVMPLTKLVEVEYLLRRLD
ncbi:chorismate mutase 2 [Nymphaea colorata]|nr:chorismate mutase 2 [Nymphaea colorata]